MLGNKKLRKRVLKGIKRLEAPRAIQVSEPYFPYFRRSLINYQTESIPLFTACGPQLSSLREINFSGCFIDKHVIMFLQSIPNPGIHSLRLRRAVFAAETTNSLLQYLSSAATDNLRLLDISMINGFGPSMLSDMLSTRGPSWGTSMRDLRLAGSCVFASIDWVSQMPNLKTIRVTVSPDYGFDAIGLLHEHCHRLRRVMIGCSVLWQRLFKLRAPDTDPTSFETFMKGIQERCLHSKWLETNRKAPDIRLIPENSALDSDVSISHFGALFSTFPNPAAFTRFWDEHRAEIEPIIGRPDFSSFLACLIVYPTKPYQQHIFQEAFILLLSHFGLNYAAPLPDWERDDGASPMLIALAASYNTVLVCTAQFYFEKHITDQGNPNPPASGFTDRRGHTGYMYTLRGPGSSLSHDSVLKMYFHRRIDALEAGKLGKFTVGSVGDRDSDGNTALHHMLFPGHLGAFIVDIGNREVIRTCVGVANSHGHSPLYIATFYRLHSYIMLNMSWPYVVYIQPHEARLQIEESSTRATYFFYSSGYQPQKEPAVPLATQWSNDFVHNNDLKPSIGPSLTQINDCLREGTKLTVGTPRPLLDDSHGTRPNEKSARKCIVS